MLVCSGFFWGHTGHNGGCCGKGIVILFHVFGITGPSVSEEHVQDA